MNLVGTAVSICYLDNTRTQVVTAASPDSVLNTLREVLQRPACEVPAFISLAMVEDGGTLFLPTEQIGEITVLPHVLAEMKEEPHGSTTRS